MNDEPSMTPSQQIPVTADSGTQDRIVPPPAAAPLPSEPPPPVPQKKPVFSRKVILVVAVLITAIVVSAFLYMKGNGPSQQTAVPTPVPTIVVTPTPPPNISRISTTSAFIAYGAEIASFSATLNAFTLQDSSLAPPILDLELGL